MFSLIKWRTSFTEAFVSAQLLENVWNWKQFITSHLLTGSDSLVGITFPHHMRFYMDNQEATHEVRVQHKHYWRDPWGPEAGTKTSRSLPSREERPAFANVFAADEWELKALDDFIAYKERCIQRLQYVDKNRDVKVEAERLKLYLAEFLRKDRSNEHRSSNFWPSNVSNIATAEHAPLEVVDNPSEEDRKITAVDQIVAMLPNVEA